MTHALLKLPVLDGKKYLHAAVKISRHPVAAAHIDFLLTVISETENAAVLKICPDDGAHFDILAHSLDSGNKTAYAPDYKAIIYASLPSRACSFSRLMR